MEALCWLGSANEDLCSALVDKEQRELIKRATPSLTRSSVFKVINMDQ